MKAITTNYTTPAGASVAYWEVDTIQVNFRNASNIVAGIAGYVSAETRAEKKPPQEMKRVILKAEDVDMNKNLADQIIAIFSKDKCFEKFKVTVK